MSLHTPPTILTVLALIAIGLGAFGIGYCLGYGVGAAANAVWLTARRNRTRLHRLTRLQDELADMRNSADNDDNANNR